MFCSIELILLSANLPTIPLHRPVDINLTPTNVCIDVLYGCEGLIYFLFSLNRLELKYIHRYMDFISFSML